MRSAVGRRTPAVLGALACLVRAGSARADDAEPPRITHARIESAQLGQAITVRAKIEDASAIFAPSIYVRPAGAKEFDGIDMRPAGDGFLGVIPAEQVTGEIEYFLEAFDEHGNGPARDGSPDAPYRIRVAADGPPGGAALAVPIALAPSEPARGNGGVVSKWWFWAAIAAAVAGGTAAVYFVARPPGSVEAVDLIVSGPDPTGGS